MKSGELQKIEELIPYAVLLPIPEGQKGPRFPNWQRKGYKSTQTPKYKAWLQREGNTGVLLGQASDGLCSIDLDVDEIADEFLEANPHLKSSLITKGNRGCNIWVKLEEPYPATSKFDWGEFRADGSQTVISGTHPTGKEYVMVHEAPPVNIDFGDITFPEGTTFKGVTEGGNTILSSISIELEERSSSGACSSCIDFWNRDIAPTFNPKPSKRNSNLVKTASFAFYNYSTEIALELAMMVYDKGESVWMDSRDQHEKEARHLLDAIERDYRDRLPEKFLPVYDDLNGRGKVAFKICRSLQKYGKGKFFLGARELQRRMGLTNPSIAYELIITLKNKKVIRCIKKGSFKCGSASEYKWVLSSSNASKIINFVTECPCPSDLCPECWKDAVVSKLGSPFPCPHQPPKPSRYPDIVFLEPEDMAL